MPSHTLNTPEEKLSQLWMSSMPLKDKEELSTDSEVELINSYIDMLTFQFFFQILTLKNIKIINLSKPFFLN
jgi:hypothetical protein